MRPLRSFLVLCLACAPLPAAAALRVAVIADLNGEYGSAEYGRPVRDAVAKITAEAADLVLIAGDMVAGGRRSLTQGQLEAMWAGFADAVGVPLSAAGIPVAPAPGNHDASSYPGYERERALYAAYWGHRVPTVTLLPGGNYPFEYAFTAGGALFVALDQTAMNRLPADRLAWLDGVLSSGAHAAKIVFMHVPLYPFAQGRETEVTLDGDLEALLARRGVSAVISGHHHAYYPGRRGTVKYAGAGCLGGGPRRLLGRSTAPPRSFLWLTVGGDGSVSVEALAYPGFASPVARTSLPERLGTGPSSYGRDDL